MSDERHTFVFADLAGFTALTEAHGDERAADIALEFCRELNRLLPEDAEDVKMLGDACLLRVGDAGEAVGLGLRLTGDLSRRHGFPDVRVGMHTGTAARRGADWFGSTINIAARVAALAGPCEVLLTAATRDAAGMPDGVVFEGCGAHELRHVAAPVHLFRARSVDEDARDGRWVIDPVCRMRLDVDQAATSIEHDGTERYFCSALCAGKFARSPDRYLRDAAHVPL
ncbi:YHS domain-containing protein [Thermoleophilum album]|uniref:YHS domain-containing protein n=1 Tax=Thermoleophilum album TaxID=29539 RepID=UPI0015A5014A|nr:YHS domain-containing protein [Thermoleophilum album]